MDVKDKEIAEMLVGTWQFSRTPHQTNRVTFKNDGSYVENATPESAFTRIGTLFLGDKTEGAWSVKDGILHMFTRSMNSILNVPMPFNLKLPIADLMARGVDTVLPDGGKILKIDGKQMAIDILGQRDPWIKVA